MGASSELFIQERDWEQYSRPSFYGNVEPEHSKPSTVKECQKKLHSIDEQIKELTEKRNALVSHMEFIGMEFENPNNFPQGVINVMIDGRYPYVKAWNTGERLHVKPVFLYDGNDPNLKKNPFFDWDSEEGKQELVRIKKWYRENE